jgi:hypothetical protein
MNPKAPHMHGTIKLHKEDKPIRPIDNWTNSPGYKVAKHLATQLSNRLSLPYIYNVKDSIQLMQNLQTLHIDNNTKLCSFVITYKYTNISTNETKHIISDILDNNTTPKNEKQELELLLNTIYERNYMQINDQFYKHEEGLAMGAPTSPIIAETFIQQLEHKLINILNKYRIIHYYRYVHDILTIYNENNTNINDTLDECNTIHQKINFTIETEKHNTLYYLDITITKKHNKLTFGIYRKPTNTVVIIHNNSCHPYEHINRTITYPITQENKDHEQNTINEILINNQYQQVTNMNQLKKLKNRPTSRTTAQKQE